VFVALEAISGRARPTRTARFRFAEVVGSRTARWKESHGVCTRCFAGWSGRDSVDLSDTYSVPCQALNGSRCVCLITGRVASVMYPGCVTPPGSTRPIFMRGEERRNPELGALNLGRSSARSFFFFVYASGTTTTAWVVRGPAKRIE